MSGFFLDLGVTSVLEVIECGHSVKTRDDAPTEQHSPGPGSFPSKSMWDLTRLPAVPGYEVLRVLGEGGAGVVYEARHHALKRLVALKMIAHPSLVGPEQVLRFKLEAQVLASLKHPNIVQVYELGDESGHPWFALELLEGGTLRAQAKAAQGAKSKVDFRAVATTLVTVARAVHAAHRQGIVHRDLKPANILLAKDGTPKIADFGIARSSATATFESRDFVGGTPGYVAPETIATPWATTHSVDVFSLGAVMYALMTGYAPFQGDSAVEVLRRTATAEPLPPSKFRKEIPKDLEVICLKCLSREPAGRYASAAALAEDLERWLAGAPIVARPLGFFEHFARWTRSNPVPVALLVATLVGASCSVAYMSGLANRLAEATALEGAAQEIDTLERVTDYYNDNVVGHVNPHDAPTSTKYRTIPGAIPNPATLTIELGDLLSNASQGTQQVRMYSDLPFQNRTDGGPRNEFEREALVQLRKDPSRPYYSFESKDGRMVLRYAKARVLRKTCAECHNSHPESPRRDWKEGDVRGALEVVRALDPDIARSRAGLRGAAVLVASILGVMLVLSAFSWVSAAVTVRRAKR